MELLSLLKLVVSRLEKLKIPYVLTGGLAVSFWGSPRTTHDIDIVIEIDFSKIDKVFDAFQKDFYISRDSIEEMLERGTSFNIIHFKTGLKVDFWPINKKDPQRILEFKRASKRKIFNKKISIIAPEDLILNKLQWYKRGESTRHLEDIKSILKISGVDLNYIKKWAKTHSTIGIFEKLLKSKNEQIL